jgi:hypothetical protein
MMLNYEHDRDRCMLYLHAQFIQVLSEILSRLSSLCQILNDSSNSILDIEAKPSPLFLLGLEFLHANVTIVTKHLEGNIQ